MIESTSTIEPTTTTDMATTKRVTKKLRRLEIRRKPVKVQDDEKLVAYSTVHKPKRIQKEFVLSKEQDHSISTTTNEPMDTRETEMEIERTADAIEKELIRAKAEVQAQQALKLENERKTMTSSESTKKKRRKHRRKQRNHHHHHNSEQSSGMPRVDGVKMVPQEDMKMSDEEKVPIGNRMGEDFNSAMDTIRENTEKSFPSTDEKPKRDGMLSVLEERLNHAKVIKKIKTITRKEVSLVDPSYKDRSIERESSDEERMLMGDDLSREIERILHERNIRKRKKGRQGGEDSPNGQSKEQQVQVSSVSRDEALSTYKERKRQRQQRIAQKKRLFSHKLIAQPTTTTSTTTETTTTTTLAEETTPSETGLRSAEILTLPQVSGVEPLQITRRHCRNIRSFAWQFGMADVTDFALRHCSYIENYYPNLTCDRAEEYMVYCRQFYKQF